MSIVMIGGGIDISVGALTGLVTMCCAVLLESGMGSVGGAILLALGIGIAFGLLQGYLISYLEIQPFIITLAGMFLANGLLTTIHKDPINVTLPDFVTLRDFEIVIPWLGTNNRLGNFIPLEIKLGAVVVVVLVVLLVVLMKWSRFGRNLYAVGGNSQSALMLGINVRRTKFYLVPAVRIAVGYRGLRVHHDNGSRQCRKRGGIRNESDSRVHNRRHDAHRRRGEPVWLAGRRTDPSDNQRADPRGGCQLQLSGDRKRALAVHLHRAAKRRRVVACQGEIQTRSAVLAVAGHERGPRTRGRPAPHPSYCDTALLESGVRSSAVRAAISARFTCDPAAKRFHWDEQAIRHTSHLAGPDYDGSSMSTPARSSPCGCRSASPRVITPLIAAVPALRDSRDHTKSAPNVRGGPNRLGG